MKSVEERLHTLPDIAENSGLNADEQLKWKILRAAREKETPRRAFAPRLAAALCALAEMSGGGVLTCGAPHGARALVMGDNHADTEIGRAHV